MEYVSVPEIAAEWGITARRVQVLCNQDRIPGVCRIGRTWIVPKEAQKPKDGRKSKIGETVDTVDDVPENILSMKKP